LCVLKNSKHTQKSLLNQVSSPAVLYAKRCVPGNHLINYCGGGGTIQHFGGERSRCPRGSDAFVTSKNVEWCR